MKTLFVVLVLSLTGFSGDVRAEEVQISLEEPAGQGVYTGVSNLRGWAVAESGIVRVEAYIDGNYAFNIPMGGSRVDVGNAFPDYPDSKLAGFSMAYNYKNLPEGQHEIEVVAVSNDGNTSTASAQFQVKKFVGDFIGAKSQFALKSASDVFVQGDNLVVRGATVEGEPWDITMSFDTATQGLEITSINPSAEPIPSHTGIFRDGSRLLYEIDYFKEDLFSENDCGGVCETYQSWMSISAGDKYSDGTQDLLVSIETPQGFLDGVLYFDAFGSLLEYERILSAHGREKYDPEYGTFLGGVPLVLGSRDSSSQRLEDTYWLENSSLNYTRYEVGSVRKVGSESFAWVRQEFGALPETIETSVTVAETEVVMYGNGETGVSSRTVLNIYRRTWWSEELGLYRMRIDITEWGPCRIGSNLCSEDTSWTWQLVDYVTQ